VLTQSAEGCFAPALAADARGRLHLAWIENVAPRTRLRYMTFLYAAPYGQAVTLTNGIDLPTPPCVTAAGDGRAYVVWPDVGSGTHIIYAARFNPDSGLSARFRLTPNTVAAQTTVSAVVDSAGVLHSVWQVSSGSGGESSTSVASRSVVRRSATPRSMTSVRAYRIRISRSIRPAHCMSRTRARG
jgi:hypothetical protein